MEVVNTVGRRKAAVARVFVKPGTGKITINHKELEVYFPLHILQFEVKQPLMVTNTLENYDVTINLVGGGIRVRLRLPVWVSLVHSARSMQRCVLY